MLTELPHNESLLPHLIGDETFEQAQERVNREQPPLQLGINALTSSDEISQREYPIGNKTLKLYVNTSSGTSLAGGTTAAT